MSLPVSDKDIVFQALEFISKDYIEESEEDVLFENGRSRQQTIKEKFFMIQIFGLTESGKTVCASVKGFRPYFYIGIPPNKNTEKFKKSLNAYIRKGFPQHVQNQIFVDEKEFKVLYDFNNNEKIPVLEISMPSKDTFNKMKNKFLDENMNSKQLPLDVSKEAVTLKIYEANIDPMLRFFHTRDISPSGWIRITGSQENEEGTETADINISAEADEVFPETKLDSAPFKIISWDIECMSSHGDFPVPKKSYRKVAREIIESKWQNPEIEIFAELPEALVGNSTKHFSFISLKNKNVIPKKLLEPEQKAKILKILKSADMKNEKKTDDITAILDAMLPGIEGDRCIQIGMTMWINNKPVEKWIYTLGSCDPVQSEDDGVPIHTIPFDNQDDFGERAMFTQWFTKLGEINPDILIGYNVFGFDEKYVWDRLDELDLVDNTDRLPKLNQKLAGKISRLTTAKVGLKEQMLSSGAMGDNLFYILEMPGRLQIDLLPYIRRNFSLQSYSLDSVSSHFMAGELKGEMTLQEGSRQLIIPSKKSTKGLRVGRYVVILDAENDKLSKKLEIIALTDREITVQVSGQAELTEINENGRPQFWCMVKDDVSPQDIFRLQKGTSADRSIVAKYCLQDCDLVMDLFNKLDALRNAQAMADVCCVPTGYIYMRGQGIKIESLIFKECMKEGQLIEVLTSAAFGENLVEKDSDKDSDSDDEEDEDSYEGAIVLEPKTGIYLDDPIATLDFASLYPSTIISENLSHDTVIWVKDYDLEGTFMSCREGSDKYDNLPGYKYVNVEFDILKPDPMDKRKNPKKIKTGERIARYVQYEDNKKGTIPKILQKLLAARKSTRKLIETEKDDFKKTLLDCQQNAYKITANSLYGQLGSKTFKIRRVVLAASTTAYGRKQLIYAKVVVETVYGGGNNNRCDAEYVYGDTDSVFINFRVKDPLTGKRILGKDALQPVKDLAIEAGKLCTSALKAPHDFEFDKMMWPFCLLSKKRYVGNKYEDDLNKPVMTSMGIVMKRRDNAPIVKVIYGGVIDRILQKHDVRGAFTFCQQMAKELVAGKFGMTKLTITKSLRAEYANPERIAHKVLADRIGARDPGNKPSSSERIGYIFVTTPKGKPEPKLQGERIETPAFIRANNLIPDYSYYIERQLAKPLAQVFALVLADLPGYKKEMIPSSITDEKKLVAKKQKIAEQLLFGEILGTWKNKQSGQMDIRSLFFPKK